MPSSPEAQPRTPALTPLRRLQAARHHPTDRVGIVAWDVSRFRNINASFANAVTRWRTRMAHVA